MVNAMRVAVREIAHCLQYTRIPDELLLKIPYVKPPDRKGMSLGEATQLLRSVGPRAGLPMQRDVIAKLKDYAIGASNTGKQHPKIFEGSTTLGIRSNFTWTPETTDAANILISIIGRKVKQLKLKKDVKEGKPGKE